MRTITRCRNCGDGIAVHLANVEDMSKCGDWHPDTLSSDECPACAAPMVVSDVDGHRRDIDCTADDCGYGEVRCNHCDLLAIWCNCQHVEAVEVSA